MSPTAKRLVFQMTKSVLPQTAQMKIRAAREARLAFSNVTVPPILIYQMGKVGSNTVYHSLREEALANPLLHLHFLSKADFRSRKKRLKAVGRELPYHIFLGEAVSRILPRPCKIISLVRDPIAYVVSGTFENPFFATEVIQTATGAIDHEKALHYLTRALAKPDTYAYVNSWFDKELKQVFGIDVFARPFPVDVGYAVYRKAEVEALVIRLEDLVQKGPKAISEFLDLEHPLVLKQHNIRTGSRDGEAYRQVLEKLRLDERACREIYSNRFTKHFYSERMIEQFISKWTAEDLHILGR